MSTDGDVKVIGVTSHRSLSCQPTMENLVDKIALSKSDLCNDVKNQHAIM